MTQREKHLQALDSFTERIKADPNIIALLLNGSLAYGTVWKESDIDLDMLVRDGSSPVGEICVVESGIHINIELTEVSKFKRYIQQWRGDVWGSRLALGTMIYTKDESLRDFIKEVRCLGKDDAITCFLALFNGLWQNMARAEKWIAVCNDPMYAQRFLQWCCTALADPVPVSRRKPNGGYITLRGAKENTLKNVTVDIPLGLFVCITGVSGSGKSTLIFETLSKHLDVLKRGARIVPGKLDGISGHENISNVITIDQAPIGRTSKSNPATYTGVYDRIRALFAGTDEAAAKGYAPIDFSLTHVGGLRCEHCAGDGLLVTNLQFMADIESICPVCKGERFSRRMSR